MPTVYRGGVVCEAEGGAGIGEWGVLEDSPVLGWPVWVRPTAFRSTCGNEALCLTVEVHGNAGSIAAHPSSGLTVSPLLSPSSAAH